MLIHDLRAPMMLATTVIETKKTPLELLVSLKDRSKAVMIAYAESPSVFRNCFVWFDPETGSLGFADASDGKEAYQLAQSAYQRETSPYRTVQ